MADNKKIDYITLVSVVSAFAVLMLHTNNCFWRFTGKEDYWFSANIIECVFYFAVPLFFMVTGVTLMDFFDRNSLQGYFVKRIKKTMIPFFVWSLIAIAIDLYTGKRVLANLDLKTVYQDIVTARAVSIYWFFPTLFVLYMCMPLYAAVDKAKRMLVFSYLVISAFLLNFLIPFILKLCSSDLRVFIHVPVMASFLIWPLIGWLLHNCELKKWQKALIYVLAITGLMIHIGGTYSLSMKAGKVITMFKGYENIPSMLYAVGVFVFLKDFGTWLMKHDVAAKVVNVLGQYAFEVYLMQFIFLNQVLKMPSIDLTSLTYRLGGPFVIIPIIMAATWLLRKIPIVRSIVP